MITVRELTKVYDTKKALDGISFEMQNGDVLGFLGPNGAGKSTTMKIITCFLPTTSGIVEVDGQNIFEHSLAIRRKIGYLPESNPLYEHMPVFEYLDFVAELRGLSGAHKKKRLDFVVEICALGAEITKKCGALSHGFRQRVGVAQCLVHDPEILILDEPTLGLDPNQTREITALIKDVGKTKTVMVSTHILPWVQANCTRIIILDEGKILADNTFDNLRAAYSSPHTVDLERIFFDLTEKPTRSELAFN